MERRLLRGILNPAATASVLAGAWLAWDAKLCTDGWFHAKVALVVVLLGFHLFLSRQVKAFQEDRNDHSSRFYRLINELPAVLMLGIVALVHGAPMHLGLIHQMGAVVAFVLILRARFMARYPVVQSIRGSR